MLKLGQLSRGKAVEALAQGWGSCLPASKLLFKTHSLSFILLAHYKYISNQFYGFYFSARNSIGNCWKSFNRRRHHPHYRTLSSSYVSNFLFFIIQFLDVYEFWLVFQRWSRPIASQPSGFPNSTLCGCSFSLCLSFFQFKLVFCSCGVWIILILKFWVFCSSKQLHELQKRHWEKRSSYLIRWVSEWSSVECYHWWRSFGIWIRWQ